MMPHSFSHPPCVRPAIHPNASQSGSLDALLPSPEGRCLSGAFKAPSPLTEFLPKVGHAPDGGKGPRARLAARLWGHIKHVNRRIEDGCVGDILGCACLFGAAYFGWLLMWAMT